MRHIISALVENKPGVLARVSGLFCARGFNIESLNVGETDNPELSRMTIVVTGDEKVVEQVRKQLSKLIETLRVFSIPEDVVIERDLALIKLKIPPAKRGEVLDLVTIFNAKIVEVTEKNLVVEICGTEEKVRNFIKLIRPFGISEMVRSGRIAIKGGE